MYVKEVTVENQVGLHARPATFFHLGRKGRAPRQR